MSLLTTQLQQTPEIRYVTDIVNLVQMPVLRIVRPRPAAANERRPTPPQLSYEKAVII